MSINLSALMKQRYDTAANWTGQNPTLLAGEIGIESDTKKWKVGTGATAWTSLAYAIGGTYPIVNADVAAAAAIAYSKLATLTSGNVVLGSAANVATSTAVTGDVTISNTGVTAIAAGVIVNADINASAAIVDTKLATISTALKVSNSATTAVSANTASAIVARDASGNFTAGTITAALTGAASSNVLKAGDTMTGPLVTPAGTGTANGIQVGTGTTYKPGIYSPGADQLAISTNGTEKLIVKSDGKVGIGTSEPGATCEIYSSSSRRMRVGETPLYTPADFATLGGSLTLSRANDNRTDVHAIYGYDTATAAFNNLAITSRNQIIFMGNGSERMRIDDSGRLGIGTTASNANGGILQLSSGITFPATAVAASDANTLDDYEEGTWTPTQGAGLTVVGAYSSQASYTKVGNIVYVAASLFGATSIALSPVGILCGGLPFTPAPPAGASGFIVGSITNQAGDISNTCLCFNTTNVYGAVAIAATTQIHFTLTYRI